MQKSVNKTLKTSYDGKEWKNWFRTTAEKIIDEIDGASATDVVTPNYMLHDNVHYTQRTYMLYGCNNEYMHVKRTLKLAYMCRAWMTAPITLRKKLRIPQKLPTRK